MFLPFEYSMQGLISETLALAAVAVVGYLFGRRTRRSEPNKTDSLLLQELTRATKIATELQSIARNLRNDIARHQSNIVAFQKSLSELEESTAPASWESLGEEADKLLTPTLQLATNLSFAYDQLRKQTNRLMVFSGSRTDRETGMLNRRALEEQLAVVLTLYEQQSIRFSLALFSVQSSATSDRDRAFLDFCKLLKGCVRDVDILGRYGSEEFVVIMPQTLLTGATVFSRRLMSHVSQHQEFIVHGGLVEVTSGDTMERIISRADSAVYSARTLGGNSLYLHTGKLTHPVELTENKDRNPTREASGAELPNSMDSVDQIADALNEEFVRTSD